MIILIFHLLQKHPFDFTPFYIFCIGTSPFQQKLKKGAVPHVFAWSKPMSTAAVDRIQRHKKRKLAEYEAGASAWANVGSHEDVETSSMENNGMSPFYIFIIQ